MIIRIVDKWNWYASLIKAGCPDRLLSTAFAIADYVDGREDSDRYGQAYPNHKEQLSAFIGKTEQKISGTVKELVDNGWLEKEVVRRQGQVKNFYTLAIGLEFIKAKGSVAQKSKENLVQYRPTSTVPNTDKSQFRGSVSHSSDNRELAVPVNSDGKHKLETLTKTETKTLTKVLQSKEVRGNKKYSPAIAGAARFAGNDSFSLTSEYTLDSLRLIPLDRRHSNPTVPNIDKCEEKEEFTPFKELMANRREALKNKPVEVPVAVDDGFTW